LDKNLSAETWEMAVTELVKDTTGLKSDVSESMGYGLLGGWRWGAPEYKEQYEVLSASFTFILVHVT
jgi:hypothetical protein